MEKDQVYTEDCVARETRLLYSDSLIEDEILELGLLVMAAIEKRKNGFVREETEDTICH